MANTVHDPWLIVDIDLSQIEFRLIAHTLNNRTIIEQYARDPLTDYHQMVADMAGLARKPAKNLNFAVAFGAGKKKSIKMVRLSLDITSQHYLESGLDFDTYCDQQALHMYNEYHRMLPELKPATKKAESIAKRYGYIANIYGRRRKLKSKRAFIAFNTYIQSSAADIAKAISIEIARYLKGRSEFAKLIGVVHDSWVFYMRRSQYVEHCQAIESIIHNLITPVELRVPIRCDVAVSATNWAECMNPAQLAMICCGTRPQKDDDLNSLVKIGLLDADYQLTERGKVHASVIGANIVV